MNADRKTSEDATAPDKREPRVCVICGCSDEDPCHVHGVPCRWVEGYDEHPVCSACASVDVVTASRGGRQWLNVVVARALLGRHPQYVPCRSERESLRQVADRAARGRESVSRSEESVSRSEESVSRSEESVSRSEESVSRSEESIPAVDESIPAKEGTP